MQCLEQNNKVELIQFQSKVTMDQAINGNQLAVLKKENENQLMKAVKNLIVSLCESLNLTNSMNDYQVLEASMLLTEKYYYLKIEELILIFKNVKLGRYGKSFNRLDIQIICEWIEAYMISNERIEYFEKENTKHKIKNEAPLADLYKNYSVENLKTPEQTKREAWQKKVDEFFKSRKND
jgi:hypothetical protein